MIQGKKSILFPLKIENLEQLRQWRNSYEIARHFRKRQYITPEKQYHWFRKNRHGFEIHKIPYGIIGYCGLTKVSELHGTAVFSIYIGNLDYQGRGIGSDALRSLLRYGFEDLGLNRIYSEVHCKNPALQVYIKLGFKVEGILRQSFEYEGKLIDSYIVGVLANEIPHL